MEKKVIGTLSHGILKLIIGKEDIENLIRDIQDIKISESSFSSSQNLPKLTIATIDPKDIVKICHEVKLS